MSRIIGIDLGTTNSVVAVMDGGEPKVVVNSEGSRLTPSVVGFTEKGERLVGQIAKRQAITNPENTVSSIKRFMGRRCSEVTEEIAMVPYAVVAAQNGDVRVNVRGTLYSPPEISAMTLQKLRKAAEDHLGETITRAVITVPAYFNDAQRQATKDAGQIAGLTVERIINEPTAAALAYGLDKKKDQTIAVFDFGGGTFDISVLEVGEGVVEVKATNGDTHLGGDNIDQRLIEWIADDFRKEHGIDLTRQKDALQRLKEAAEKAKMELSSAMETEVNLPFITADATGPKHIVKTLTRMKFEQLVEDILQRTIKPCERALADAALTLKEIDEVVLVGGSTRIPRVGEIVRQFFQREPHRGVNPDEVVAVGAAVQGGILSGDAGVKDILLLDVTPLSLGVETLGGVMTVLIPRNTTIPTRKSEIFSTAADSQPSVEIHVLQGEREFARGNRTLGRFHLDGIPPAPRGIPKIEVSFDIDANGIAHVGAKDLATNREQTVTITASSGLDKTEVSNLVEQAEAHAEDDKKRRAFVELKNQADQAVYLAEKTLRENEQRAPEACAASIREACQGVRKEMEGDDEGLLKSALGTLEGATHRLAEELYRATGAGAAPPPPSAAGPGGGPSDGGGAKSVIDAEYVSDDKPS